MAPEYSSAEDFGFAGDRKRASPHNSSSMCRSRTGMGHHRIPCGGRIGGDISHPPSTTIIYRVNFCNGNFYLIWRDNHFSKAEILFPALFSCTAITAMKYSGTMSIGRCSSSALCAERGVCTGLGEHMDPRGGSIREAVHKFTCVHILHLLQIISSVASGPGCHA